MATDAGQKFLTGNAERYQPLLVISLALAAGIVAERFVLPEFWWSGFGTLWLLALSLPDRVVVVLRGGRPVAACGLLLISIAATGGAWHELRWNLFSDNEVARFAAAPTPACSAGHGRECTGGFAGAAADAAAGDSWRRAM